MHVHYVKAEILKLREIFDLDNMLMMHKIVLKNCLSHLSDSFLTQVQKDFKSAQVKIANLLCWYRCSRKCIHRSADCGIICQVCPNPIRILIPTKVLFKYVF